MTRLSSKLIIGTAALLLSAGLAFAQTTPATPPVAAPKAAAPKAVTPPAATAPEKAPVKASGQKKASTPEGAACSAEADQKGLHGKERKTFRRKCIADAKKAAGAAPAKKN